MLGLELSQANRRDNGNTDSVSTTVDFDELTADMSEQQLSSLALKAVRRLIEKFGKSLPLTLRDENEMPIAIVLPVEKSISEQDANSEFIRNSKERAANPSPVVLAPDEFLVATSRK